MLTLSFFSWANTKIALKNPIARRIHRIPSGPHFLWFLEERKAVQKFYCVGFMQRRKVGNQICSVTVRWTKVAFKDSVRKDFGKCPCVFGMSCCQSGVWAVLFIVITETIQFPLTCCFIPESVFLPLASSPAQLMRFWPENMENILFGIAIFFRLEIFCQAGRGIKATLDICRP